MGAPLPLIASSPYEFRLKRYSSSFDRNCPSTPAPFRTASSSLITAECKVIILSYFENSSINNAKIDLVQKNHFLQYELYHLKVIFSIERSTKDVKSPAMIRMDAHTPTGPPGGGLFCPAGVAPLAGLFLFVELFPKWKRLFYEPVHRQAWRKPLVSASSTVEA